MEHSHNDRIERNLDDVIGNNDDDIGPVIDAVPYLALRGELGVHGAGLHLALTHEFLQHLTEVLFDYPDSEFEKLEEAWSSSSFTSNTVSRTT